MTGLIALGSGQPTSVAPPEDTAPKLVPVPETPVVVPPVTEPDQLIVPHPGPPGTPGAPGQNGHDGDTKYDDIEDLSLIFENGLI